MRIPNYKSVVDLYSNHYQFMSHRYLLQHNHLITMDLDFIDWQQFLMFDNRISLEGTLFLQAFKAYVDNNEKEYMKQLPILSYQFQQIQTVLKHKELSQLIAFLKKAKEVVSSSADPDKLVPGKLKNIDSFLNRAYLEEWQRKYKIVKEMNIEGLKLSKSLKTGQAIKKYKQSIRIMPTEDAIVNLAYLYLSIGQPSLFKKQIEQAESIANDDSLLPIYESIFKKLQGKLKPHERYLCAKVMILFGSKDKSAYFEYVQEAVRRKEKIDKKIMQAFPQSFEKRICQCIILKGEDSVQQFLKLQKQIFDSLSYPNSDKHKQSNQHQLLEIIDLFYLYLSRACADSSFSYREDRCFYIERGLNYKPNSYYLLKQMCSLNTGNPRITESTAEQLFLAGQSLSSLQARNNHQKIYESQLTQIIFRVLAEIMPQGNIVSQINNLTRQHQKQHEVFLLAAKLNLHYGDLSEAERTCQEYYKLDSNLAEYYAVKGHIHCKKKQFMKAKNCYKKSYNFDKNNATVLFCLASIYYSQKKYKNCIQLLQQAKKLENTAIELRNLYQLKLKAHNRLREYEMAEEEVQLIQNSEITQISGQIAFSYAEVKFHKGRYKEAIELYEKALKTHPRHDQSRYRLILTQLICNPGVAGEQLEQILENTRVIISKQKNDTQYLALYGYLLIKSKKFDEALEALFQSINRNAQSCYTYFHLGRLLKERKDEIDKSVMDGLGLKIAALPSPTRQYVGSFLFLAVGSHELFLYNFDTLFKYYKGKIQGSKTSAQQFLSMFKRLIGNFHYLNAIYPGSDDILLISAMLYRAIDDDKTVQRYIKEFLSKYRVSKQPLSEVILEFYNKNSQYHKLDNYFPFILQFLFQELLEHHPWQMMTARSQLGERLDRFTENPTVNSYIINYLSKIADKIKQFKSMSNQFRQQMNAFSEENDAEASVDQYFQRLIQSHLRSKRAYHEYNDSALQKNDLGYNRIKESEGMQFLSKQMKVYEEQMRQSPENKVQQLLKQVTNLVIIIFTFDSLWAFLNYDQAEPSRAHHLLQEFTKLIKQLIQKPDIEQSQKKLSSFINILIQDYSLSQSSQQQPDTQKSHSFFQNLEDELQSTMFSLRRTDHSSPFSLQSPKTISKCKQLEYKALKPYSITAKQDFNSSIIHIESQISTGRSKSSAYTSSIFLQQQEFNFQEYA